LKLAWDLLFENSLWARFLRSRVIRKDKFISHHIFSSIWSGIKNKLQTIWDNSCWILGKGNNINFWKHDWCGEILAQKFNIPVALYHHLNEKVQDFIVDNQWYVPLEIQDEHPTLLPFLQTIIIPFEEKEDQIIWRHSSSGLLSLKDAYNFHRIPNHHCVCADLIWNIAIPPSKSLLIWRLIHNRLPTDENLSLRGCNLPSMCNQQSESSLHLFLHCSFAASLWKWLGDIIKIHINVNSIIDVLQVTNRGWSPQCKLVITSAILNIVNLIWISRNNLRFNDVKPSWNSVTSLIIAHVSLAGNQTVLSTGSSIVDFQILKAFKVNNHPPRAPRIIEVIWHPPIIGWVKCNTDGSSSGNPGPSACGGVFRNFNGDFLGCFAVSIGLANVLKAELWGIIFAIEAAFDRGWNNLWIESDSMVATWALKSPKSYSLAAQKQMGKLSSKA
jgi:hypothetical protein